MGNENSNFQEALQDKYLAFPMADDFLAIDVRYVEEIVGIQEITRVPKVPEYIEGVINLRGRITPILNAHDMFIRDEDRKEEKCIIIIGYNSVVIGLKVERVDEVLEIKESDISVYDKGKANETLSDFAMSLAEINGKVVHILDCEKLFLSKRNS